MAHMIGGESTEQLEHDETLPDWIVVGESVSIRPYNSTGVIGFVGKTHFQVIERLKNEPFQIKINRFE